MPQAFLESPYSAADDLGAWDRKVLGCATGVPRQSRAGRGWVRNSIVAFQKIKPPPIERQGLHAMLWTPEAILLPNELISHMPNHAKLFQHTSLKKRRPQARGPRAEYRTENRSPAAENKFNTVTKPKSIGRHEVIHQDSESNQTSENKTSAVEQPGAEASSTIFRAQGECLKGQVGLRGYLAQHPETHGWPGRFIGSTQSFWWRCCVAQLQITTIPENFE